MIAHSLQVLPLINPYNITMQNIEIKRNKNKRSIESLIEESALDNSFNYEAHELRKAFNETLLTMNAKNTERDREIEKLRIILKEHEENKAKYESKISKFTQELANKNAQLHQLTEMYNEAKKRLQYLEFKFQNISQNRNLFERSDGYEQQDQGTVKKRLKTQAYSELNRILVKKIDYFTIDLKKLSMSSEVEERIESFLQELLYLNPYSEFHILDKLKMEHKQNSPGKIRKEAKDGMGITAQEEWRKLEKSLQKLKEVGKKRTPLNDNEPNRNRESKRQRSISISKRRKMFN